MGNMLSANVIAINSYKNNFNRDRQLYIYRLANGATYKEAHAPFIKGALIQSFNPTIASMAIMGLISLLLRLYHYYLHSFLYQKKIECYKL